MVSVSVPIWLTLIRIELAMPSSMPCCRRFDVGDEQIVADQLDLVAEPSVSAFQPSQSSSAMPSSIEAIG